MDAVYAAPGYLFRRMQQIAVSIFMEECRDHDLTRCSSRPWSRSTPIPASTRRGCRR